MTPVRLGHASVARLLRYVLNGVIATCVHYAVLSLLVGPMGIRPVGLVNLIAALTGAAASFLGNRRFVFKSVNGPMRRQALNFAVVYGALALVHSAYMYIWSDQFGRDYQTGFVGATVLQFLLSYIANSQLVFKNPQMGR